MITYKGDTLSINLGILRHDVYVTELVDAWKVTMSVKKQGTVAVKR